MGDGIRAMVQVGPERLEMQEFARPQVGDDDALLRIEACGICGTDAETYTGGKLLGERTGRDEIALAISKMRYTPPSHLVGQQQADIQGDTATGETYCLAHHLTVPDDGSPATDFIMLIRYQDQFVRLDEGWRFAVRELHIDWTENRLAEGA